MTLAPGQELTAARADIVLDSPAGSGAIEAALARLEAIARDKGLAIGVASALPASIETIGRFARALEARGIALVPLSGIRGATRRTATRHVAAASLGRSSFVRQGGHGASKLSPLCRDYALQSGSASSSSGAAAAREF